MDDLGDLWWTDMMAKKAVQLAQIALIPTDEAGVMEAELIW